MSPSRKINEKIHDFDDTEKVVESTKYIKEQMKKIVLDEINKKGGKLKVLDSGCGTGEDIIAIKRQAKTIDAYGEDIHIIKKSIKFRGCSFRKSNIERDFNGLYDIIISSEVIHCLLGKNVNMYLKNLGEMLKPDGLLVLTTFNREYLWKTLYRIVMKGESQYHSTHVIFTPDELKDLLEQNGFKVERIIGGRFLHGDHFFNRLDFLPKTMTNIRHNFLIAARKVKIKQPN